MGINLPVSEKIMSIFLYDYRPNTTKVSSLNIEDLKKICSEINLEVIVEDWLELVASKKAANCTIILGHFAKRDVSSISEILGYSDRDQVIICVAKYGCGEALRHDVVTQKFNKRIVLYVRDMNALNTSILKRILSMTFNDANKIVESGGAWVLGWQIDPFNTKKEALVALYTLCQGYLASYKKESLESLYSLTQSSKKIVAELSNEVETDFWVDIISKPAIKDRLANEMRIENIDRCCIGTLFELINNKSSIQPELILEVCQFIRKQL
jgi:hypothetical protein